jgi:hypothetical protein
LEIAVPDDTNPPRPPQPPEFERKFQLYPYQYITMPLIFLIPILALLGLFGDADATQQADSQDISVQVEYPARTRYKVATILKLYITNHTDAPLSNLDVSFDRNYIDAFLELNFLPVVSAVTEDAYIVTLEETIPPGETHAITVDLHAEKFGVFAGTIMVDGDTIEPVSVRLESLLFP